MAKTPGKATRKTAKANGVRKNSKGCTSTRRRVNRKSAARIPGVAKSHPDDVKAVRRLERLFDYYNSLHFGGRLRKIYIRVSRRAATTLGLYTTAGDGLPEEISISYKHIENDPWRDIEETLLHEMVHQWQDQIGTPVDHGELFKWKCRRVGISPTAVREN